MKVQKRSLVMDAVQVNWKNWNELADLLGDVLNKDNQARRIDDCLDDCGESGPFIAVNIPTPNGVIEAIHGEWVLKDNLGQFWVMDPPEFAAAYAPVPDAAPLVTAKEEPLGLFDLTLWDVYALATLVPLVGARGYTVNDARIRVTAMADAMVVESKKRRES